MALTVPIFRLQSSASMNRTQSSVVRGSPERMDRNISPIINFDALLFHDLSRINTSRYLVSRIIKQCLLFRNKYGIQMNIDYWSRIVYPKVEAQCEIRSKTNFIQKTWTSLLLVFISILLFDGRYWFKETYQDLMRIRLNYLEIFMPEDQNQGHKDYSRLSLCLSFRVSLISVNTDYYFTVACDSYLISSSRFTSIFNGYNSKDYAFIYKDNYQNSDHFLYSMSIFYYIFRTPISNYFLFCKTYNEGIFLLYLIL